MHFNAQRVPDIIHLVSTQLNELESQKPFESLSPLEIIRSDSLLQAYCKVNELMIHFDGILFPD